MHRRPRVRATHPSASPRRRSAPCREPTRGSRSPGGWEVPGGGGGGGGSWRGKCEERRRGWWWWCAGCGARFGTGGVERGGGLGEDEREEKMRERRGAEESRAEERGLGEDERERRGEGKQVGFSDREGGVWLKLKLHFVVDVYIEGGKGGVLIEPGRAQRLGLLCTRRGRWFARCWRMNE